MGARFEMLGAGSPRSTNNVRGCCQTPFHPTCIGQILYQALFLYVLIKQDNFLAVKLEQRFFSNLGIKQVLNVISHSNKMLVQL
jgi:hypothetical protein